MPMFLTMMALCFPLLVLCALVMLRQQSREQSPPVATPERRMALPEPRFFVQSLGANRVAGRLPRELLLRQIERHVRLEVAAAESFLELPSTDSLHAESGSPLMN